MEGIIVISTCDEKIRLASVNLSEEELLDLLLGALNDRMVAKIREEK